MGNLKSFYIKKVKNIKESEEGDRHLRIGDKLKTYFVLNLGLVLFLLINSYIVSSIITKDLYENICIDCGDKIVKMSEDTFMRLDSLVYDLANNKYIGETIQSNKNKKEKEKNLINLLGYTDEVIKNISFAENVSIFDIKDGQMYTSNGWKTSFDILKRPWYKKAIKDFQSGERVLKSQIHKDLVNDKYTISIISFIKSKEVALNRKKSDIVGCVILNIYLDDYLKYIKQTYGLNDVLDVYIKIDNNRYYCGDSVVKTLDQIKRGNEDYFIKKGNFIFSSNKIKFLTSVTIKKINIINLIMFFFFFFLVIILHIVFKKKILNSLIKNMDKLKRILEGLNKYDLEIKDKDYFDQIDYIVGCLEDTVDDRIKEYILTDILTGALNRRGLEKNFEELKKEFSRIAVIFIDLDKFKNINDIYGHAVGDRYLKEFVEKLKEAVGTRGVVSRISGDEFVILYKYFWSKEDLIHHYETNIENVFNNIKIVDNKLQVRYSAGVSMYPDDGEDLDELIRKSDFIMYNNKKKGASNKLTFFDDKGYDEMKKDESLSLELTKAIKKDELYMVYQPIVDKDRNIVKAEALMRWKSSKFGFIPPSKFIKIAEDNKEIINIGYWAFDRVAKDIVLLKNKDLFESVINVNVSAVELLEPGFAENVKCIIDKYDVTPRDIGIEITESVMIDENGVSFSNIKKLKEYGFDFSLDDFGTGYTSFSYLKKFEGEILKIDKSILDDAEDNGYRIINSIKDIGKELNFDIVIEGVEEEEQFNMLKEIDCDLFQGYLFSKPIEFKEFIEYLKNS